MTDIALSWDAALFGADIAVAGGDLVTDDGLRTAVILSLFSDARARDDDALPDAGSDRRGWWGDVAASPADDRTGSRLWLLARSKNLPAVLANVRDYVREALAWLIEDGVAASIDIVAETPRRDALALGVTINRPGGAAGRRFDFVWEATL